LANADDIRIGSLSFQSDLPADGMMAAARPAEFGMSAWQLVNHATVSSTSVQ
jgi:hypothetical protein